jgi:hypothetical protein
MEPVVEFEPKCQLLRMSVVQDVDDRDLLELYQKLLQAVEKTGARFAITDCSRVGTIRVSAAAARRLAYHAPNCLDRLPRCLVVPGTRVRGLVRIYQMLGAARYQALHVVDSLEEAYRLLRIQPMEFEPVDFEHS